jgi:phosphoglycolate phosphatase-like HAD superfamily hydrolase
MSLIRVIILDFDGVLAESNDVKMRAFEEFCGEYPECGEDMLAYHMEHISLSRMHKFRYYIDEIIGTPGDDEMIESMAKRFSAIVKQRVIECPPVAGAVEFLEEFSSQLPLYVSSVTPSQELNDILEGRGIKKYIKEAFGDPPCRKAEAIRTILDRENAPPEQVVFIGDSASDYAVATEATLVFYGRDSGQSFAGIGIDLYPDLHTIADRIRGDI